MAHQHEELERWQAELLQCTEALEQARLELVEAAQQQKDGGADCHVDLTALQEKLQRVPLLLQNSQARAGSDSDQKEKGLSRGTPGVLVKLGEHTWKLLELALHTMEQSQDQETSSLARNNDPLDEKNMESGGLQLPNRNKDLRPYVTEMVKLIKRMRALLSGNDVPEEQPAATAKENSTQEVANDSGQSLEQAAQTHKPNGAIGPPVDRTEDSTGDETETGAANDQQGSPQEKTAEQPGEQTDESTHRQNKVLDLGG